MKETENIEFKRSLSELKAGLVSMAAILNKHGKGELWFGIRNDVPEISVDAMREAIINAFCHRDYRDPDYVQVAIYKNRVEIRNPGGLFGGITIADLRKGHVSKRRNPLVADLFRRIEMVEAWGRGMPLIRKYEPDVEFKEIADIFIVSFGRPSFADDAGDSPVKPGMSAKQHSQAGSGKSSGKQVSKGRFLKAGSRWTKERAQEGSPNSSPKSSPKTEERIIDLIAADCMISTERIGELLGISKRAVLKQTRKLQDAKRLKRIGPARGGHWEVQE
jgi:ATP-dependent DNA helicase RecG